MEVIKEPTHHKIDPDYSGPELVGYYFRSEKYHAHYIIVLNPERCYPETWAECTIFETGIPQKSDGKYATDEVICSNGEYISITAEDSQHIANMDVGYKYFCVHNDLQLYYDNEQRPFDAFIAYTELIEFAFNLLVKTINLTHFV